MWCRTQGGNGRKEALAGVGDEGESALDSSIQGVISRYSFMDLWPCSSKDMDHLTRQEVDCVPSFLCVYILWSASGTEDDLDLCLLNI